MERAATYPDLLAILEREVRPERELKDARKYPRMVHEWWKFWQYRQGLERAVAGLDHVPVITQASSTLMPVLVPTGPVFDQKVVVFARDSSALLALLSSAMHSCWVVRYAATLGTGINYSPSDVFQTFPFPALTRDLGLLGEQLHAGRRELMLSRGWGLTTTYNHVHNPADRDPAVVALRDLHTEIDEAVLASYGWDLDLEIGHHTTKIGTRWTVSPRARFELLDLLLEENHRRAGYTPPDR